MSKGITVFYIMLSVVVLMAIAGGLGFYQSIGMSVPTNANDDVQDAADALIGQEATDRSGGSVLQDFTTAGATSISSGWQVLSNTSGILQLLLLFPPVVADNVQLVFQLTFGLTFAFYIRGLLL